MIFCSRGPKKLTSLPEEFSEALMISSAFRILVLRLDPRKVRASLMVRVLSSILKLIFKTALRKSSRIAEFVNST